MPGGNRGPGDEHRAETQRKTATKLSRGEGRRGERRVKDEEVERGDARGGWAAPEVRRRGSHGYLASGRGRAGDSGTGYLALDPPNPALSS